MWIKIGTMAGGHETPGMKSPAVWLPRQLADVGEHMAKGGRPKEPDLGTRLDLGTVIINTRGLPMWPALFCLDCSNASRACSNHASSSFITLFLLLQMKNLSH